MSQRKRIFLVILGLSILYFIAFIFPNKAGSENLAMVEIFEPDEAVPLPYILDMIKPAETVKEALINFASYGYYFYGYPVFGISALILLPIKWMSRLGDYPLMMGTLRQLISVLPMLIAIILLVYWRTRFKDYRAIVLFVLLASLPAVVQNNFWWHPDSLAILFAVLTLIFLSRDQLKLGRDFYLAAMFCGFSAGTKSIGLYFFLTVLLVLLLALISKKVRIKKVLISAVGFLLVMALAYLFSNPLLIFEGPRNQYFNVMQRQSQSLLSGYEVYYKKGIAASWPAVKEFFGSALFVILVILINVWGAIKSKRKLDNGLILSWALPLTVMVFFISHFKFQYWLPVFLPLMSSVVDFLPEKDDFLKVREGFWKKQSAWVWIKLLVIGVILFQLGAYIVADLDRYDQRVNRVETSDSIQFYETVTPYFEPYLDRPLHIYHDVRMYFPDSDQWSASTAFEMLNYKYITGGNFDALFLMQQRFNDYLNPNVVAIDEGELEEARAFYRDADRGEIEGYELIYREPYGLFFIKEGMQP
jgi:hypothetical protein